MWSQVKDALFIFKTWILSETNAQKISFYSKKRARYFQRRGGDRNAVRENVASDVAFPGARRWRQNVDAWRRNIKLAAGAGVAL